MLPPSLAADSPAAVPALRVNWQAHPLAVPVEDVRFAWRQESEPPTGDQRAYRIRVTDAASGKVAWDSGRRESIGTTGIRYAGPPLEPGRRYAWSVETWHAGGTSTFRSSWFETTPQAADWKARWIAMEEGDRGDTAPLLRRGFALNRPVQSARVHVAGIGYHELYVNGQRSGDAVLDPAQTDYERRVLFVTHDVTPLLHPGENVLGVILGDGWYAQDKVWTPDFKYGPPSLRLQLCLRFADRTSETISTDGSWRCARGPTLSNNVHAGEIYDARQERPGWSTPGHDDADWMPVAEVPGPKGEMVPQQLPPVREMGILPPVSMAEVRPGTWVYDFGQNLAGWCRLRVRGTAGTSIRLQFAEELDPAGLLDHASTGVEHTKVIQTDVYTCRGDGEETWAPRFCYHGFRYVELTVPEGTLSEPPTPQTLEAVVVHSSLPPAGRFTCSDALLNRIHEMALWTQVDNLHGVPTDCPIREKCGWLGDAHVVAEMTLYNFDSAAFWEKYLGDIRTTSDRAEASVRYNGGHGELSEEFKPSGIPSMIAPGRRGCGIATADWGAAVAIIPWQLWCFTGDAAPLREMFLPMRQFIDYIGTLAREDIVPFGLGDWCSPQHPDNLTPIPLISTFFYWQTLQIAADTAEVLGEPADELAERADRVRARFIEHFYDAGRHTFGSQTADALALAHRLHPETETAALAASLAQEVEARDFHFTTGMFGLSVLFGALADHGYEGHAHRLLTRTTPPSFGDLLSRGATTIWEQWPTGDERGGHRYSLNHPMNGAVDAFFYRHVGGIRPDATHPGFRHFTLRPQLIREPSNAGVAFESVRGRITSEWTRDGDRFQWRVRIPPTSRATLWVPVGDAASLRVNGEPAEDAPTATPATGALRRVMIELNAGQHGLSSVL